MSRHKTIKQMNDEFTEQLRLKEEQSQKDASRKLSEIIAKHTLREQLSIDEFYTIARKIFPILSRSDEIILSMNFLKACAELLFASEVEFWQKINNLMLLFIYEIYNFPFHPMNSQQIADETLKYFIDTNEVDDTNRDDFCSAIHLLMKLYTRHGSKFISPSLNVYVNNFNIKLCAYPNNDKLICFSLFGYGHNKYKKIMSFRPPNSTIIKCTICKLEPDELTTIENLVLLIAKEGIHCKCWSEFVEANPGRNIQPCSAKGCDGSLCPFCVQYKEMQLMKFIGRINDLFKRGSLSEDVYNGLFDTFCQIIIGGSSMPVMPLLMKLYEYLPTISVLFFDELFRLINDFEIFFRRMKCLPRPNFLSSTPNLRDFTKADYDAYMDELKRGQENFQTVIPKLGFCCCNENIEYRARLEDIEERNRKYRENEKVADAAVTRFKGTRVNCC